MWIVGRGIAFYEEFDATGKIKSFQGYVVSRKTCVSWPGELWKLFRSIKFVTEDKLGFQTFILLQMVVREFSFDGFHVSDC